MKYPIKKVPLDASNDFEQLGSKYKFWYYENDAKHMFKEGRAHTGEDWAEVAASRICDILGIPHATYEFAEYNEGAKVDGIASCLPLPKLGVTSKSFVPKFGRLLLGNEFIAKITLKNDNSKSVNNYKRRDYTFSMVIALLTLLGKSPDPLVKLNIEWSSLPRKVETPLDVFMGFIMLDALIANQDRHHENWGFIVEERGLTLAPTYDHASSLGRNESDKQREERLTTKDTRRTLEFYAKRAQSAFFGNDSKRISTFEAFSTIAKRNPAAAHSWLDTLKLLDIKKTKDIFESMPKTRISKPAIKFAVELIEYNKNQLMKIGIEL